MTSSQKLVKRKLRFGHGLGVGCPQAKGNITLLKLTLLNVLLRFNRVPRA